MIAYVNKYTCVGCGLCTVLCEEVFQMDDDGKAEASESDVPAALEEAVKESVTKCPVEAISYEE